MCECSCRNAWGGDQCERCPENVGGADCNACAPGYAGDAPHCTVPPSPPGWGDCPPPGPEFGGADGAGFYEGRAVPENCDVVHIAGAMLSLAAGDPGSQWEQGLRIFQDEANKPIRSKVCSLNEIPEDHPK